MSNCVPVVIQHIYNGLRWFPIGPVVFCGVGTVEEGPMEVSMGQTKHTAFRLSPELIARLDREAKRMSRETSLEISRTDVLRRLITEHCGKRSGPTAKGGSKK